MMRAMTTKGMHTATAIVVVLELDLIGGDVDDGGNENVVVDTDGI
jgi:hypothetical protein